MALRISVAVLAVVALGLLLTGTGSGGSAGGESVVRGLLGLERSDEEVAILDDLGNPLPVLAGSRCVTAPGRSALDQYCQSIPDGAGGLSVDNLGGDELTVAQASPKGVAGELTDAGQDGSVLLGLPAARGASEDVPSEEAGVSGRGDGEAPAAVDDDGAAPPLRTVPSATRRLELAGTSAQSQFNPALLIVLVLAAAGVLAGVARLRRPRGGR